MQGDYQKKTTPFPFPSLLLSPFPFHLSPFTFSLSPFNSQLSTFNSTTLRNKNVTVYYPLCIHLVTSIQDFCRSMKKTNNKL